MANVSYLRSAFSPERSAARIHRQLTGEPRRYTPGRYLLGAAFLVLALLGAGAFALLSAQASLTSDSSALARVGLPLGGGTVQRVSVFGPRDRPIPIDVRGGRLWPRTLVPAGERVSIEVVVKRPGWIGWLAGRTVRLSLTLRTPTASLQAHYLTLRPNAPLRLHFKAPIQVLAYGPPGLLQRHLLASPTTVVTLPRGGAAAGTISVAAAPRAWETAQPALVSWFPAGGSASAVANPAPGTKITPTTPLTLTFSRTVSAALGSSLPPVSPRTQGTWHTLNSHTIQFVPEGYGYGLSTPVTVGLPSGVRLLGGDAWTVPAGSTLRVQQLLAQLGYLPLRFNDAGAGVAHTPAAQEAAATNPPAGQFEWRYGSVPSSLRSFWSPGASGVITQGALMAFENDHGLSADGVAGPTVWRSLIDATLAGKRSSAGYSYVTVNVGSQSLELWHDGQNVLTTAVNTGIASRPTATGTFPVFEHLSSTTMSGTNPDGSHYSDPGIQWVSYFNGGDALHSFTRAQYGSPQSLGCVEMALEPAARVWPYTPIGTLVHVA